MAAAKLAVQAAMARRMFHAAGLYRWVLRNLATLPEEGNVREFYCAQARSVRARRHTAGGRTHAASRFPQEFNSNTREARPDALAYLWQDAEEKVAWLLKKYDAPGAAAPAPRGGR